MHLGRRIPLILAALAAVACVLVFGGAASARERSVAPDRLGMGGWRDMSYDRSFYCLTPLAHIGTEGTPETPGVVAAGVHHLYDAGTDPFACWERYDVRLQALIHFTLPHDQIERLNRAELRFRRLPDSVATHPDCHDLRMSVGAAATVWSGRTAWENRRVGASTALAPVSMRAGDERFSLDVTAITRAWLAGTPNNGFVITPDNYRTETPDDGRWEKRCRFRYSEITLWLDFDPRPGPAIAPIKVPDVIDLPPCFFQYPSCAMPLPTATPAPTTAPTPTATPVPTVRPTATPVSTTAPTATPSPGPKVTPSPTPSPTPVPKVTLAPMTISGTARQGKAFAPAPRPVEAIVRGTVCGATTSSGPMLNNYRLVVLSEAERAGCGRPGDIITFRIGGAMAVETTGFLSGITLSLDIHTP